MCTLVTFPQLAHFDLAFSGDGCALFHLNFYGFILIFKVFMVDNIYLLIQWKFVLYCINFEVINIGYICCKLD